MNIIDFEWITKVLTFDTEIKPFESSNSDLNDFLLNDAKKYLYQRLAVTYIIENNTETIGYFCLSNDVVMRSLADNAGWKKIKKTIPNSKMRSSYPAVKIGRLAVSHKYENNGFGRLILQTVKKKFVAENQQTGCRFVTVDAKKDVVDFYTKNLFDFLTSEDENENTRLMYFDLNSLQQHT